MTTHFVDQESHALVVRRVRPKHPVEDAPCLVESTESPEAQAESMHAADERTVVHEAPGQIGPPCATQAYNLSSSAGSTSGRRLRAASNLCLVPRFARFSR